MNLKRRAALIVEKLHQMYPQADCTIEYQEPWQLLAGAILASQCTDARVNLITPQLFSSYPDLASLASAKTSDVENIIRSCGLFRAKAKALVKSAQILVEDYNSRLPADRVSLMRLPGVGRKIANLMLGDYFAEPAIVVDTHCGRISRMLGLTDKTDPLAVEKDLEKVIDRLEWVSFGHLMVNHGREICIARSPKCEICGVNEYCNYARKRSDEGKYDA